MAEQIKLSDDDRSFLKEIIAAVGFTQKALAEAAEVDQPWLSQALSGKRQSVDSTNLKKVTDQLVKRFQQQRVDDAFSKAGTALAFLSRFSLDAVSEVPRRIDRPGDLIPSDAPYYVERNDQAVLSCLSELPFAVYVAGPVQCGKSSLLKRLESKARDKGLETAWLYPVLPVGLNDKNVTEINANTASQFAQTLEAEWNLELPRSGPPQSIPAFLNWIKVALAPTASKPRLLVIDDFSAIGPLAADKWIAQFVRLFWNNRAHLRHQVSLAVGQTFHFNQHFESLILHSSMVNWDVSFRPLHTHAEPTLHWFSEAEVTKFRDTLAVDIPSEKPSAKELYLLFQGQPYLTHAAVHDPYFYSAVREWSEKKPNSAAKLRSLKSYHQHFKVIKRALLGPSYEMDRYSRELLVSFSRCSQDKKVEDFSKGDTDFLLTSMLIDDSCQVRIPMYRLFAEDLGLLATSKS